MARFRFAIFRRRRGLQILLVFLIVVAYFVFTDGSEKEEDHFHRPNRYTSSPNYVAPKNLSDTAPAAKRVLPAIPTNLSPRKVIRKAVGLVWDGDSKQEAYGMKEDDLTLGGSLILSQTKFERGIPGFIMLSNLYVYQGVLLAITNDPDSLPQITRMLSGEEEDSGHRGPAKADRYKVISVEEGNALFGTRGNGIARLGGTTFFFNDAGKRGLLPHYFHLIVENFVGAWKVLASTPEAIHSGRTSDVVFPTRFIFPHTTNWKDPAGMNTWFMNTALPSTTWEDKTHWEERAREANIYVFDQIVLIDRGNYHRDGGKNGVEAKKWNKMTADVLLQPAPFGWFEPVRYSVMKRLGITDDHQFRDAGRKVITYINRQETAGSAHLTPDEHDRLVATLSALERDPDYYKKVDVYVVKQESLDRRAMLQLLMKTDVLLSVRTPQQSHQLWMKPGSAIFEFFEPGHYTHDSEMLSEGFGHAHHVVHKDKLYNWKETESYKQSNGGNIIPVSTDFVVDQVRAYLATQGLPPDTASP